MIGQSPQPTSEVAVSYPAGRVAGAGFRLLVDLLGLEQPDEPKANTLNLAALVKGENRHLEQSQGHAVSLVFRNSRLTCK